MRPDGAHYLFAGRCAAMRVSVRKRAKVRGNLRKRMETRESARKYADNAWKHAGIILGEA